MSDIHRLSIEVNVTLANDIPGSEDVVDIPSSKALAEKLIATISNEMFDKGFPVNDSHISVGKVTTKDLYYLILDESDRDASIESLKLGRGMLYTQRLDYHQLIVLHKAAINKKDAPPLKKFGFDSDATLVVLVDGRTIGVAKSVGAVMANIAIMTVMILAATAGGSSGGNLLPVGDTYNMKLRLFSTHDGDLLWQKDTNVDDIKEVSIEVVDEIQERLPNKP